MPRLRQQPPSDDTPAASDVRLALSVVLDGPRPGRADPEADRVWRELRAWLGQAAVGTAFDPRRMMTLTAAQLDDWRERRYAWAAALLADRVEVDG